MHFSVFPREIHIISGLSGGNHYRRRRLAFRKCFRKSDLAFLGIFRHFAAAAVSLIFRRDIFKSDIVSLELSEHIYRGLNAIINSCCSVRGFTFRRFLCLPAVSGSHLRRYFRLFSGEIISLRRLGNTAHLG